MSDEDKRKPKFRPQPIARMLDAYLSGHPGARKARGLAALRRDWADIVGPDFKDIAWPERIDPPRGRRPAELCVRATAGTAVLLQHDGPRLVARVNDYLGAAAIGGIRIVPGAPPRPAARPDRAPPPLAEDDPRALALAARAERIGSDPLAAALVRLGRAVAGARETPDR